MIPADFIAEWRQFAPWKQDEQVEQDLIISRALLDIFSNTKLSATLAFRGGTALHKLFVLPPGRYSEDIDLVQIRQEPIGETIELLRGVLDPWLGKPKREFNDGSAKLVYRVMSEGEPAISMRLKVEINTREHFAVLGWKKHPYEINSRWHSGSTEITTYSLDELLGTKLRALYQRKKGRDLFDLWLSLRDYGASGEKILECFAKYMEHENNVVNRATFEANLDNKMLDKRFTQDISPLLRSDINWDIEKAMKLVRDKVLKLMD